jgi:hypothetical protein
MDYFTGYNKNLDLVDFFNTWIYDAGDHDFQVISFIEQGVAGKFVLQAQQQRRHKVNLIKKAELNLKIYYQNGSSLVVPVALVSDWSGMAKAEVSLSTEQNKNIAFVVLNEDNKLALAKTYQREWIKTTGIKNLNNALFTCTVSEVKDSALIYVEHHFASPFAWVKDMPAGIRISNERYWSVQGLWKEGDIKATAFLNYDGSTPGTKNGGFLDNELIKGLEDSLVLLYRPNPNEPFIIETDLTFQPGGSKSDKVGRFWINKLKKGDYAIGYKDITASNKSLISNEYVLKLFPNPTNDVINIELPQNHGNAKISIFNTNGVLIDTIAVKKNEQVVSYQTKDLTKGNYLLLYEEGKSKLNKTFIVY